MSDTPQPEITSPPPPSLPRAARAPDYDDDDDYRPRRRRFGRRETRGVLPRSAVRTTCFVVLVFSLILAGAMCIMAVWDAAPSAVTWKAVTTLGIVAAMTAGFTVLNEAFGQPVDRDDR